MSEPAVTIQLAESDIQTMDEVVAAADTLRLHGTETTADVARQIVYGLRGAREDVDPTTGEGKNTGTICTFAWEGLHGAPKPGETGKAWCAALGCQSVRQALLRLPEDVRGPLLAEWMTIASGDCDVLWDRMTVHGLTTVHEPGAALPAGAFFLFLVHLDGDGRPITHSDGRPNIQHLAIVMMPRTIDVTTIEGNHRNAVGENSYLLTDRRIHGTAELPKGWW